MRVAPALLTALVLIGCGAAEPAPPATPAPAPFRPRVSDDERRAREAVDGLMAACAGGDLARVAAGIVDRDMPSSEWHRAMDVTEPGRREAVESVCRRVNGMRRGQDHVLAAYRKERQSEGVWHLCTVRYASGESEIYAFLEIDGRMLLGDIDPAR